MAEVGNVEPAAPDRLFKVHALGLGTNSHQGWIFYVRARSWNAAEARFLEANAGARWRVVDIRNVQPNETIEIRGDQLNRILGDNYVQQLA